MKKKIEEIETLILKMQKTIDEHELKISHLEEKNTLLKELLLVKKAIEEEPAKAVKGFKKTHENNVTSIQRIRTIA